MLLWVKVAAHVGTFSAGHALEGCTGMACGLSGHPTSSAIVQLAGASEREAGGKKKLSPLEEALLGCDVSYEEEDYEGAVAACTRAIGLDPKGAEAYVSRSSAYIELNDSEHALADVNKAIEFDPKNVGALVNRAIIHSKAKDLDKALADINEAIAMNTKDPEPYHTRGRIYEMLGKRDEAIQDYRKALVIDAKYEPSRTALQRLEAGSGSASPPAGGATAEEACSRSSGDAAIAACMAAIKRDPTNAAAYSNLGFELTAKKDFDQALANLNKAIELDPKLAMAYLNRAQALKGKNNLDGALADVNKAMEIKPDYVSAYIIRARIFSAIKEFDKAAGDYQKALSLNPKQATALFELADIQFTKADYAHALESYDRYLEIQSQDGDGFANRGLIKERLGRRDEAIDDFRKALQLDPDMQFAKDHLKKLGAAP